MGVIARQASWSTLINYIGVVIGFVNVIFLVPQILNAGELGLRSSLIACASILAHLAQMGITQVLMRYFPHYRDNPSTKRQFLFFVFFVPFVPLLLVFGVVWLNMDWVISQYSDNAENFAKHFYLVFPLTFIVLYQGILEFYSRVLKKIIVITLLREIVMKGSFAVLILAFSFGWVDDSIFWDIYVSTYFLATVLLIIYLLKLGELRFQLSFSFLTKRKFREIAEYSLFGYLSGFSGALVNSIDMLMISRFVHIDFTGAYTYGVFIATMIDIPRKLISQISVSHVAEASKDDDVPKLLELYQKTSLNQAIIGLGLFLVVWLNIDTFFAAVPNSEDYEPAKYVVLFICVARLINMIAGVNGEIVQYSKYYRFNLYSICVLGALSFFTNYLLIETFGNYAESNGLANEVKLEYQIIGVAIATAFSIISFNTARTIFILRKMKIHPFTINTLKVFGWFLFTYLLLFKLPNLFNYFDSSKLNAWINMCIRGFCIVLVYGAGVLYFRMSEDVNSFVMKLYSRVFKK